MNAVSREEILEYARANQLPFMHAKERLENSTSYVLQYCPPGGTNQDWTSVPFETQFTQPPQ